MSDLGAELSADVCQHVFGTRELSISTRAIWTSRVVAQHLSILGRWVVICRPLCNHPSLRTAFEIASLPDQMILMSEYDRPKADHSPEVPLPLSPETRVLRSSVCQMLDRKLPDSVVLRLRSIS